MRIVRLSPVYFSHREPNKIFLFVPLGARHEIPFSCIACAACRSFPDRLSPIKNAGHAPHGAATQSQPEPAGGCLNNGQSHDGGRWLTTGLAVALVMVLLSACGGLRETQGSTAQKVELNGLNYRVEQITASTWIATPAAGMPNSPQQNLALVKAIEKASGCKVTDSSVGQQGTTLNAQVDCGSRLKN